MEDAITRQMKAQSIYSIDKEYYQMITSTQKRRNFSKEILFQNKPYLTRPQASTYLLNSYQSITQLREKSLNKALRYRSPQFSNTLSEEILKKKTSLIPFKINQQLAAIDSKFTSFSSKIKHLLKSEEEGEEKENLPSQVTITTTEKTKSAIFRRSELLVKQLNEKPINSLPYFIECLKRKTMMSTEACMHIHNSIMTFKQFSKIIQLTKARTPDINIPPETQNRKTIVFDMDETLIHTNETMVKGYELKVPFKTVQGKPISGYVNVRPYAKEIIKNMSRHCDVMVFTAGNQCYADPILDYLDPDKCLKYRLYRQSCTCINNQLFVKDLRILGRKLQNVVLVDNAPHSYMMQLSNGIPILNYIKGKDDDQLVKLEHYLMTLINVEDVRKVNSQTFKMHEYPKYESYDLLIRDLYSKWL